MFAVSGGEARAVSDGNGREAADKSNDARRRGEGEQEGEGQKRIGGKYWRGEGRVEG